MLGSAGGGGNPTAHVLGRARRRRSRARRARGCDRRYPAAAERRRLPRGVRRPDAADDPGVRPQAGRAARVRDAVQAGAAPRRHLRRVPGQGRVHDPAAGGAAARARPPERRRVQRGRRADDDRDRQPRGARARAVRARGRAELRAAGGAVHRLGGAGRDARDLRRPACCLPASVRARHAAERPVRRGHRHVRARLDADVLRHGAPLRDLHPGLEQPGAVPRVDLAGGHRAVPRPGPAAAVVGVRGDLRRGLQRGVHVGAARTCAPTARRRCGTWWRATGRCR